MHGFVRSDTVCAHSVTDLKGNAGRSGGISISVLRCTVQDWSLSSRMSSLPSPRLSLSVYIASCRQATRRSQMIVVVTQQNLEAKKKNLLSNPLFVLFFVLLSHSFGHVVLTLTENRPEVIDFKR